jgi:hypothetical protein
MSRWGQRFVISPSSRMDAELWPSNSRVEESIAGFPKRIAENDFDVTKTGNSGLDV